MMTQKTPAADKRSAATPGDEISRCWFTGVRVVEAAMVIMLGWWRVAKLWVASCE